MVCVFLYLHSGKEEDDGSRGGERRNNKRKEGQENMRKIDADLFVVKRLTGGVQARRTA